MNPADKNIQTFQITRNVCVKERMKITIYNQRGYVLLMGKEDESFDYRIDIYGVSRPEVFFNAARLPEYSSTHYGKIRIYLTKNMFRYENMEQCLTNIKVKTVNNGTYQVKTRKVDVFVNVCEDEIVTIEYLHCLMRISGIPSGP